MDVSVERGRQAAYLIIFWRNISVLNRIEEVFLSLSPAFFMMQLSSSEDKETRRSQWREDELCASVNDKLTTWWKLLLLELRCWQVYTDVCCLEKRIGPDARPHLCQLNEQWCSSFSSPPFSGRSGEEKEKRRRERERECISLCWSRRCGS